jgi:hypothetical protein
MALLVAIWYTTVCTSPETTDTQPIYLRNLPALVVPSNERYPVWVTHLYTQRSGNAPRYAHLMQGHHTWFVVTCNELSYKVAHLIQGCTPQVAIGTWHRQQLLVLLQRSKERAIVYGVQQEKTFTILSYRIPYCSKCLDEIA